MPINQYDRPAQAQFIDTYVPIPFNELLAAGQAKQQRYDQAAGAMDAAIASAEQINAIPFSDDERRAKEYVANMRAIRDKYVAKDLSDPFVMREMSNDINRSINKEDIKHIEQSYQGYVNYNKLLSALTAEGKTPPNALLQNFAGYDSRAGVFTGSPTPYLDPITEVSTFMKDIRPDMLGSKEEVINGAKTGRLYSVSGVTENKLLQHANENMESLLRLPAVRQMVQVAKLNGDTRDASEIATEFVKNNAKKWAYTSADNFSFKPEWMGGGTGVEPDIPASPEVAVQTGLDKEKSKQENRKFWDNETRRLNEVISNPNSAPTDIAKARNELRIINSTQLEAKKALDEKTSMLYDEGIMEMYNRAVDFYRDRGESPEKGIQLVDAILNPNKDFKDKLNFVAQGTRGAVSKAMMNIPVIEHNLLVNKAKALNVLQGVTGMVGNLATLNLQGAKETGKVAANRDKVLEAMKDSFAKKVKASSSEDQLVNEISKMMQNINKQSNTYQKEASQTVLDNLNKTRPVASTATLLNNEYSVTDDGKVEYKVTTPRGTERTKSSAMAQSIKDWMKSPQDYVSNVKTPGKEKYVRTLDKIREALNNGGKFTIDRIDNQATEQGEIKLQVSTSTGYKGELVLPNVGNNLNAYATELEDLGKEKLVYDLGYTNPIREAITTHDWGKSDRLRWNINQVKGQYVDIVENRPGYYKVYLTIPQRNMDNVQYGEDIPYNDLPGFVKDLYYEVSSKTR